MIEPCEVLQQREESKRDAMWQPAARWEALMATITWAENQSLIRRNTREECLRRQSAAIASLCDRQPTSGDSSHL